MTEGGGQESPRTKPSRQKVPDKNPGELRQTPSVKTNVCFPTPPLVRFCLQVACPLPELPLRTSIIHCSEVCHCNSWCSQNTLLIDLIITTSLKSKEKSTESSFIYTSLPTIEIKAVISHIGQAYCT